MAVFGGCVCSCTEGYSGPNCNRNCSSEIDLVFILDASGSITLERMQYVRNFTVAIVESMNVGPTETRVGVVYFSTSATVAFTLDQHQSKGGVIKAITKIPFVGDRTNLADAQRMARKGILQMSGNRPNVTNVIVMLTDAVANEEVSQTIPENILLKNVDIDITETVVITASVGDPNYIDFNMIDRLASQPIHKNIHVTRNFSSLIDLADPIVQSGCNDHNECSPNPCQNGATCVDGNNRYTCLCPVPYTGFDCQKQCSRHYDVVFVLDLSGSVGDANEYPTVTNFTREVVAGLSSSTNVGIVTFDTVARSVFYLNTYTSRRQLLNAINFYTPGGKTNV
jgi:collagen type VI alpha